MTRLGQGQGASIKSAHGRYTIGGVNFKKASKSRHLLIITSAIGSSKTSKLHEIRQDVNNHIFVIAYAIVDVENKDNWKWFLILLHEDLGDYKQHNWTFVLDMQKIMLSYCKHCIVV
ncbi:hypothetical protein CR513_24243, partial [Mucuna pruriens]